MPTITLTWHATLDNKVCPICKALDGYKWSFTTGKDLMTDSLWHPAYGQVWSLSQGSNAHGHGFGRYNCRCGVTAEIDVSDLKLKVQRIRDNLKAAAEGEEVEA